MNAFVLVIAAVILYEAVLIISMMMLARRTEVICRVPALDVAVSLILWIPWVAAFLWSSWLGVLGSVVGQLVILEVFNFLHPIVRGYKGPTIKATSNRIVGPVKNYLGLYTTILTVPIFLIIRFAQLVFWPLSVWTMKFPKYDHGEWVNVSRQKFSGLVGHDLVWCLYCDWMTGVYSLGGEMLRNVESFWCPIRFNSEKKCENCKTDFPDVDRWVPADGSIENVKKLLDSQYPPGASRERSWFGHKNRK